MNLFQTILDKAKLGADYLSTGKLGTDIFDATHNEDPTQTIQYKALQGAANLYTGAAEEAATSGTREFESKKEKARQFLSQKGYAPEVIENTLSQIEYKPGYIQRVREGLGQRMQEVAKTTETLSKEQNLAKRIGVGTLAYGGDVVATGMEPVASALSPVVQKAIEKSGQTENVQKFAQDWEEFKVKNPLMAESIEGVFNVGQLAPVPLAKPLAKVAKQGGKAIVRGAETVAPKVVQGVKTGVSATSEGVGKVTKSIVSQQSGLGTPAIESILKTPELQSKIRSGELSAARTLEEARSGIDQVRQSFRETGKMYDTVRKSDVKIPTSEAKQVILSQLESEGLSSGGKLNLVDLPVKDRGAITQALKYIDEYKGEMTPQNALSIRQKLDDLINYKSDVGSNGQRIVQGLRAKYDEFLGGKLPGLKEIDAQYAPERQFWESVRKDIYKSDGTLKDNALSVISNITNKGNEARLARMEQIIPGIGEKVKALKAFEDIQTASGIKVGTYTRAATTGGLALVNPALAIASWVATHPVVVARVLEGIGLASQKIKSILSKGKKITPEEAKIVAKAVAETPKSKVEAIINNLAYDPKTNKLTSGTIGPKKLSTMGKMEIAKTPKSIIAEEGMRRPFTMGNNKPIVKRASDETLYHGSSSIRELKDFDLDISMQKAKQGSGIGGSFAEGPGIYLTSSKAEASGYGPKVSEFSIKGANIIEKNGTKSLSRQEVSNLLSKIDKDTLQRAIDDWGSKNDLIDNIMEQGNTYEQLMDVWASVFSQQNPKGFVNAVKGIGIDALKVPKEGTTHYVIYNPDKFVSSPKPLSPQKTVKPKNLTEGKQSMGDMETKKLIEEAGIPDSLKATYENLKKEGISEESIKKMLKGQKIIYGSPPAKLLDGFNPYDSFKSQEKILEYMKQDSSKWSPVVITNNGRIIDGWHRLSAYMRSDTIKKIPYIIVDSKSIY